MAQLIEVTVPDIGDFSDVEVIEILVSPGDELAQEDSILTLESDKATMEIPSPEAGVIKEIKVSLGDKINQGDLILILEAAGEAAVEENTEVFAAEGPVDEEPDPVEQAPAVAAAPAGEPSMVDVEVPDIGDFASVEVIEILVSTGDSVAEEDSLITLESDKATMEIPSPHAGTIKEIKVSLGDKVAEGNLILSMEVAGAAPAVEAAPEPAAAASPAPAAPEAPARAAGEKEQQRRPVLARPSDAPKGKAHASPAVRRFARELGVDLYYVPGSGPKGRIIKEDVQAWVKRTLAEGGSSAGAAPAGGGMGIPSMPSVDFSKFGEIEQVELGRIKKISGAHLHRAWLNVPHVTQFDEADITELEAFRKAQKDAAAKQDVKLTFMPFLMKAVAAAMQEFPQFNSSLASDGESLIMKKYIHIGVAVDTPNGLVVPVIRDVDQKGVFDLGRELMEIGDKARNGKLGPNDMQGGCISISSLGGIGGTQFTPIVNAPEVAILGISRAEMKPKWNGADFEPRLMMPFSLSYDHRVIDGAEGVRFTTYLNQLLGDIRRLLL